MQLIVEQLDLEWNEIKDKLPNPDEAETAVNDAQATLDSEKAVLKELEASYRDALIEIDSKLIMAEK